MPLDENCRMLEEYDFSGGVRGKHAESYRRAMTILVRKPDGTVEVRDFALPEGFVWLDDDMRVHFPDAEAVNRALRGLIRLIPKPPASAD